MVNRHRAMHRLSTRSVHVTPGRQSTSCPLCCGVAAAASCRRPHRPRCFIVSHPPDGLAWLTTTMINMRSPSSSSVLNLRPLTMLHAVALQSVAASGNSQASEADMQQLRMQLGERNAEVQQLRSEVTALKVCNIPDATLVLGSAFTSGEANIQTCLHADRLCHVQLPSFRCDTILLHYRSNFGSCNRTHNQSQLARKLQHSERRVQQPTKTRMQM